jgi:hypothetical protein
LSESVICTIVNFQSKQTFGVQHPIHGKLRIVLCVADLAVVYSDTSLLGLFNKTPVAGPLEESRANILPFCRAKAA